LGTITLKLKKMKKIFYIKTAVILLMATTLLSSCLKDDSRYIPFSASAPVVDFGLAANVGTINTATISGAQSTNPVNFLITVQSVNPTTGPVTVNCVIDQAAMTAQAPTYTLLPASTYTVGSLTVTVPPGTGQPPVGSASVPIVGPLPTTFAQGQAALTFTLNTAAVKALPAGTYGLPVTIASASGLGVIVDQFHTLIYKIVVGP